MNALLQAPKVFILLVVSGFLDGCQDSPVRTKLKLFLAQQTSDNGLQQLSIPEQESISFEMPFTFSKVGGDFEWLGSLSRNIVRVNDESTLSSAFRIVDLRSALSVDLATNFQVVRDWHICGPRSILVIGSLKDGNSIKYGFFSVTRFASTAIMLLHEDESIRNEKNIQEGTYRMSCTESTSVSLFSSSSRSLLFNTQNLVKGFRHRGYSVLNRDGTKVAQVEIGSRLMIVNWQDNSSKGFPGHYLAYPVRWGLRDKYLLVYHDNGRGLMGFTPSPEMVIIDSENGQELFTRRMPLFSLGENYLFDFETDAPKARLVGTRRYLYP